MITESEERRIDEIYNNHAKLWIELQNKVHSYSTKIAIYSFALSLSAAVIASIAGNIVVGFVTFVFTFIVSAIIFLLYYDKKGDEELEELGFSKEELERIVNDETESDIIAYWKDYYKEIWRNEADFTKGHLKYLAMKLRIEERDFKNFLYCPYTNFQLKEREKDDLVKIFENVREKCENIRLADECKVGLTPWEFFRRHFYGWMREEEYNYSTIDKPGYSEEERYEGVERAFEKVFNIFKEFDKAPRISGDLAVELEDLLEENKDISPVSKAEVMKLVEAWRKYKLEERLYI
ncbi:MAG: hypothetical protein WA977_08300 [Halobacteriota archaeon]